MSPGDQFFALAPKLALVVIVGGVLLAVAVLVLKNL
jgi:hypothetical protein